MQPVPFWRLNHASDAEILSGLDQLIGTERSVVARVIAHLAQVQERRLDLKAGCSSLFDYCLRRLKLSEGEAYRRMTAARLARRFPLIFELVESGALHLTAVCLLRDHLTEVNHQWLLGQASHKTKRQVEELVAREFPRPDVPSRIRRLPSRERAQSERAQSERAQSERAQSERAQLSMPAGDPATAPPARIATPHGDRPRIDPLSRDRYRLQFTMSTEVKEKLELARDLMSHSNPTGDLAVVVERALDLLVEALERQRFAKTRRPRSSERRHGDAAGSLAPSPVRINPSNELGRSDHRSRHVPNATRREVIARDGACCSFVDSGGRRCGARSFLQFHHETAWARGGTSRSSNVRVLCEAHNRLLAERDFGRQHMDRMTSRGRDLRRHECRGDVTLTPWREGEPIRETG